MLQADRDGLFAVKPADMAELSRNMGSGALAEARVVCEFPPKWKHQSYPGFRAQGLSKLKWPSAVANSSRQRTVFLA